MGRGKTLLLLFFGLLIIPVSAQDSLISLDTFTVSSLRISIPQKATGRDIVVLEAKDLQHLPVTSVDELLRYVPGLEAQSRGAFGVQSDFSLQGATFSQVLVLVDGIRINDPLTGHFNSNLPITLRDIARVEVLKGPAAAMYGADAMGGVINIITQIHTTEPDGWQADLQALTGAYTLRNTTNYAAYQQKKWKITGSYDGRRADGHPLDEGDSAWFAAQTLSLAARYQFSDRLTLTWRGGYDFRDFSAKYFYTRSPFDAAEETITSYWQQAQLKHIGSHHRLTADVAYKWTDDAFLFNPSIGGPNEHTTQLVNSQIDYQYRIHSRLTWGAGVQSTYRSIASNDRGNHHEWQAGVYSSLYYQPLDRLHLNGSMRIDHDENYGWEASPQMSAAYWWTGGALRFAAGRSIRAADFTERFISTNLPGPLSSGRNLGNPNLSAEDAWQAEVGVDITLRKGITLNTTSFYRTGQGIIDYVLTPAGEIPAANNLDPVGVYLFANNIASVNAQGIETRLQATQHFSKWQLHLQAGYRFTAIKTAEPVNAKYITGQARHLLTIMAQVDHERINIGINGLYKVREAASAPDISAFLTDDYMVWHMRIGLNMWQKKGQLFGQIHNIFNQSYADVLGAQMPGRWWSIGGRFQIAHLTP